MERQIVCFQIPHFRIELARAEDPSLRHRPVAVAHGSHKSVLSEVSKEAKKEGIYPGMAVNQARSVCRSLRILVPDSLRVRLAHQSLLEIAGQFSPIWEPITLGHFYLDLTGTTGLFGRAIDAAVRMEREVLRRFGLSSAIAVATNKLVSGIAATLVMRPPDLYSISPGRERDFLAPLPVVFLPGLRSLYGSRTSEVLTTLEDLNLDTLGKIGGISLPHLVLVLGRQASLVHQWALGIDPTPVWPPASRPSLEVSHSFSPHEIDDGVLLAVLYSLLERLCRRLRLGGRTCRRIKLNLMHRHGVEIAKQRVLDRSTCWEADVYPYLQELFFRSFKRRVRIREATISVDELGNDDQFSLFTEEDGPCRMQKLVLALDHLRARYGEEAIRWSR
jgi:DNA polymerase-4